MPVALRALVYCGMSTRARVPCAGWHGSCPPTARKACHAIRPQGLAKAAGDRSIVAAALQEKREPYDGKTVTYGSAGSLGTLCAQIL